MRAKHIVTYAPWSRHFHPRRPRAKTSPSEAWRLKAISRKDRAARRCTTMVAPRSPSLYVKAYRLEEAIWISCEIIFMQWTLDPVYMWAWVEVWVSVVHILWGIEEGPEASHRRSALGISAVSRETRDTSGFVVPWYTLISHYHYLSFIDWESHLVDIPRLIFISKSPKFVPKISRRLEHGHMSDAASTGPAAPFSSDLRVEVLRKLQPESFRWWWQTLTPKLQDLHGHWVQIES